jgi:TP901 family phage tail tape measure protein
VQTVANESTGTAEEFGASLDQLAKDMDNNISKAEAASASYDILSAGYKDLTEVNYILGESQKVAIGGLSDLGTVSDATTTILNAYGDQLGENLTVQEKTDKILNGMINTQNEGKITAGEYAQLIGNVASTAASANINLEELNAVIAVNTADGAAASTTIASMNQAIASISSPTAQAAEHAKQLGIEFNATALQSMGLEGFLKQLTDAGADNVESLVKLFGSVEAANTILKVVGDDGFAKFEGTLSNMKNNTDAVTSAYEQIAATDLQKTQAAMNAFNDALLDLGAGVQTAFRPAIEALTMLVQAFNSLSPQAKQAIGLITTVAGVTLTLSGALALTATAVAANIKTYNTLLVVKGKLVAATKAEIVANMANVKSLFASAAAAKSALLAMTPLIATLGLVTAAVGALVLGWKHWENIQTEKKAEELNNKLKETEPLVNATFRAVEKMRETGKALPNEEFDQLINLLKEADGGTGVLQGQIDALTRQQEKYKQGVEETTNVQEENTQSTEELIQASDDKLAAIEDNYSTEMTVAQASATSQEALIDKQIELERKRTTALINELKARLQIANIEEAERAKINNQIQALEAEMITKEKEASDQKIQIREDAARDSLDAEKAYLEAQMETSNGLINNTGRLREILEERTALERQSIQNKLATTEKGSAEYQTLKAQELEIDANYLTELEALRDKENELIKKGIEERNKLESASIEGQKADLEAAYESGSIGLQGYLDAQLSLVRDSYEEQNRYLQERLDKEELTESERADLITQQKENYADYIAEVKRLDEERLNDAIAKEQNLTNFRKGQLDLQKQSMAAMVSYEGAIDSAMGSYASQLGKIGTALKDENIEYSQKNKLMQVGNQIRQNLSAMGININGNLQDEEALQKAINEIELKKVENQIKQIENKRKMLEIDTQIQKLELENQIQQNEMRLASGTLSETEQQQAMMENDLARQNLSLLGERYSLQQEALTAEGQALQTSYGIEAATRGVDANQVSIGEARSFSDLGGASTNTVAARVVQPTVASVQSTQASLNQPVQNAPASVQSANVNVNPLVDNTNRIIDQLGAIWSTLNGLPPKIAQSLPRASAR